MKIGDKGLALIREFEGTFLKAYRCPAGIWTIGTGTVKGVYPGMTINALQAEQFLRRDLAEFETSLVKLVNAPVNQNQADALLSFTYNCGSAALSSSTLLKKLNAKDYNGAANEFLKWNRGGGKVLAGLTRRRKAERSLFLAPATEAIAPVMLKGGKAKLRVTQNTVFKREPVQAFKIANPEFKVSVKKDIEFSVLAYQQEGDHFKVTLDGQVLNGMNTWHCYYGHIEFN